MKRLNGCRMRRVFIGIVAALVTNGSVKADFTFGEPVNLGPTINSSAGDLSPSLTGDGLELYFMTTRAVGFSNTEIWFTSRATTSDPWGEPKPINLRGSSTGKYWEPDISADALSLYLTSSARPDDRYGGADIYMSTRPTKNDAWSEPVNIGPPVNTSFDDACSCISRDGLTLYFSGNPTATASPQRPGGYGMADIWFTTKQTSERMPEDWYRPKGWE